MNLKLDNLSSHLSTLFVVGILLCPSQAFASGAEARRAYVTGRHLLALELARPAAERGDSTAMLVLGSLYFQGAGVRQDYGAALNWWRAAAELGNFKAQSNIGMIFRNGLGVERNYDEAIKWFESAAAKDEAYAHWYLGQMHENGEGFAADIDKAIKFYKKALDLLRIESGKVPETRYTTNKWIDILTWRINWLTISLTRHKPTTPMPSTPQNSRDQETITK